jgi:hypothetical protein
MAAHISTVSCADGGSSLFLHISAIEPFFAILNGATKPEKESRVIGVAVGTREGLILRSSGDVDMGKFARGVRLLNLCERLHDGAWPQLVVLEEGEGRVVSVGPEFGKYVVMLINGK